MKTIVMTIVVGVLLTSVAAVIFVYSGVYDVSASTSHSPMTQWLMSTTMRTSVSRRAEDIVVPDLDNEKFALAGINDFEAMCVGCHGAPGKTPTAMGQGLNPPAPDLQQVAPHRTPAELFWVTKYGIKMTGMPAWGSSHDDDTLWPVVALVTRLPGLDVDKYSAMLVAAKGMGHHVDEAHAQMPDDIPVEHEVHRRDVSETSASAPKTRQDHSSHDHKH